MSQSRSIRFQQIRLVTVAGRVEILNHPIRSSAPLLRAKNKLLPPLPDSSSNIAAHPKKSAARSDESINENVAFVSASVNTVDEGNSGPHDEDLTTPYCAKEFDSDEVISLPAHSSLLPDEADQRVSEISAISILRSMAMDSAFQMIADSVARISNDEANDRNGPWHFEMNCATHRLPSTTLFIELSRDELLLRFISLDASTVRLISSRKEDLQSRLVIQLRPARSVQIEVVSE